MKKVSLIIIIFIAALIIVPSAYAFSKDTHRWIAERSCDELDCGYSEVISDCAILPDQFFPFYGNVEKLRHRCIDFPFREILIGECFANKWSNKWLEKARIEDTESLKWCYIGIASHYFADARIPPHRTFNLIESICHDPFELEIKNKIAAGETNWTVTQCDYTITYDRVLEISHEYAEKVKNQAL